MKRVHLFISGKVQGVYFRAFVKENAENMDVKGWVRNTDKGVEVLAEGTEENIEVLLKNCEEGSPTSLVENLEITEGKYTGEFNKFAILR
ncbi:MAG: acylphosphatase [archaeon]|jgi:acylphosphatase|nr:acylphosphatase [Euryarchaeota archaeon]MDP6704359.1 acylphosphatase [archaeon]HIK01331.1 acylphosphatase [Candidatus Undinarchaeales archaeon ERR594346 U_76725]|tara:strand:+ start:724 stop:993 length:270 start_codon:yes stop_codon:yes gene_type:complete